MWACAFGDDSEENKMKHDDPNTPQRFTVDVRWDNDDAQCQRHRVFWQTSPLVARRALRDRRGRDDPTEHQPQRKTVHECTEFERG
jgi:hypothetical protein